MVHEHPNRADDPIDRQQSPTGRRILLAEDDRQMRLLLASALQAEGYDVTQCRDGDQFVDHVITRPRGFEFDLIISDVRMPGHSGLELLAAGQQLERFPPMILITAFGSDNLHSQARRLGAVAVFDKPFDIDELVSEVTRLLPPG